MMNKRWLALSVGSFFMGIWLAIHNGSALSLDEAL
jgi:hypothetical protein